MTNDSVFMAGAKKCTIIVWPRAIDGKPSEYEDVVWWKVTYSRILVIRQLKQTEILARDMWGSMRVIEK